VICPRILAKILSLVFKAEIESFSPPEHWNKALLDKVLNELFDQYYEALKMDLLAYLEPFDKAIARIAETIIVAPVAQENPMPSTPIDHFWKRSYSVVATASESDQSNRSDSRISRNLAIACITADEILFIGSDSRMLYRTID